MALQRLALGDMVAIGVGGVGGALARRGVSRGQAGWFSTAGDDGWFTYSPAAETMASSSWLPWSTIVVNVIGCLILGLVAALLVRTSASGRRRSLLAIGTGFCGSLTTFSTFALDAVQLLRDGGPHAGSPGQFTAYLAISVAAGALAFICGRAIAPLAVRRST